MDIVLIGATTLETQGLEVDPATGSLKKPRHNAAHIRRNNASLASEGPNPSKSLNTAPRSGPAPPTQNRRRAVEALAEALTNAVRSAAGEKALETIRQRGYLDRHTYVEALQQEFAQELRRHT